MAAEDLAKDLGIKPVEAFQKLLNSPAYDAIYNLSTGLWGEGPDMLLEAYYKQQN